MLRTDARELAVAANVSKHGDIASFAHHRHVNDAGIAPQAGQNPSSGGELVGSPRPICIIDDRTRPRSMAVDRLRSCDGAEHVHPSSLATFSKPVTSAGGI